RSVSCTRVPGRFTTTVSQRPYTQMIFKKPMPLTDRSSTFGQLLPSIRAVPFGTGATVMRLAKKDRQHLAAISTVVRVKAGTVVYRRGEEARFLYNISSGTICSYRERSDGTYTVLAFLFAEDLFGLARRGRYVNTVRAVTPVAAFRFPIETLVTLV